jgi:nucleotidyltransferase substrate binding protein (TIGR01987 family)
MDMAQTQIQCYTVFMDPKDELKYIRFKQRFSNFEKAYAMFDEISKRDTEHDEVVRMALTQAFEITFELAWKAMGDKLESEKKSDGDDTFPREIIRKAYEAKYVDDQNLWTKALENRNKSSHAYSEEFAIELEKFLRVDYAPALKKLYEYFRGSLNK